MNIERMSRHCFKQRLLLRVALIVCIVFVLNSHFTWAAVEDEDDSFDVNEVLVSTQGGDGEGGVESTNVFFGSGQNESKKRRSGSIWQDTRDIDVHR